MTFAGHDVEMIRLLVVNDWQVHQKQLAGYLAGLLLALSLIGTGIEPACRLRSQDCQVSGVFSILPFLLIWLGLQAR